MNWRAASTEDGEYHCKHLGVTLCLQSTANKGGERKVEGAAKDARSDDGGLPSGTGKGEGAESLAQFESELRDKYAKKVVNPGLFPKEHNTAVSKVSL